jgi:hypothetical protein
MRRTAIPYAAAIQWMVDNDDTHWAKDDDPIISVTACLVADIYGRTNEEVISDLRKSMLT